MSDGYHRGWTAAVAVALAVGAAGCLGTDVGNPQDGAKDGGPTAEEVDVEVRFEGLAEEPSPGQLALEDGLQIEEVWLTVDRVGLRPRGECNRKAAMSEAGLVAVELLGEEGVPAVVSNRASGAYCGFDIELAPLPERERGAGTPEALAGRSVLIRGEVDDGPQFELRDTNEFNLALGRPEGTFTVDADSRSYLLTFVLEHWVEAGDLRNLEGESVTIDRDRHADLLVDFREAFRESAYLFRDANADGRLQADERGVLLADSGEDYEWEPTETEDEAEEETLEKN